MIEWQTLHAEMLADIQECLQGPGPEIEQVESAFKIAGDYWQQLRHLLKTHWFENTQEEIEFYKKIKPAFTSYIEYFTMIYSAHVLQPKEDMVTIRAFWEQEGYRYQKFLDKSPAFFRYYSSGATGKDYQYFLPANYELARIMVSKPYETDGEFLSSHDHLVAGLLAHEMYREYTKKKLQSLS